MQRGHVSSTKRPEPRDCGVVQSLVIDEDSGVAWVETDSHGLTLSLPLEGADHRAPRVGESIVYDAPRELVGVGPDSARRWFPVSKEASELHELHWHAGRARVRLAMILVLSVALVGVAALQVFQLVLWLLGNGFVNPARDLPTLASTVIAWALLIFWVRAIRQWTFRPVLGVAMKGTAHGGAAAQ
jgi:hypothetical protein